MDIVAEKIPDEDPEVPEQPTLTREMTATQDDLLNAQEAPVPKKRGRPPGSKNKPKVIEEPPPVLEPEVEEEAEEEEEPPPPPPKPKKTRAKAKAKPAQTYAPPPPTPQPQPQVSTPLQVAASMLEILRLEQAERQHRKSQLYKSWVK